MYTNERYHVTDAKHRTVPFSSSSLSLHFFPAGSVQTFTRFHHFPLMLCTVHRCLATGSVGTPKPLDAAHNAMELQQQPPKTPTNAFKITAGCVCPTNTVDSCAKLMLCFAAGYLCHHAVEKGNFLTVRKKTFPEQG